MTKNQCFLRTDKNSNCLVGSSDPWYVQCMCLECSNTLFVARAIYSSAEVIIMDDVSSSTLLHP